MELKLGGDMERKSNHNSSNRTFMELKYTVKSFSYENKCKVLIVPLWN